MSGKACTSSAGKAPIEPEAKPNHKQVKRRSSIYETRIAGLYDLGRTIGKGHYAVVKLAKHVFTGEKVAVKVIDKTALEPESRNALLQEVRCMKLVQHPNIVRLYEVIDTATKLFLVLELADLDLYEYLLRFPDKGLPETEAQTFFAQIVEAINFCHQLHVVHRDLKPENVVFLEDVGMVKLTDFGFSNCFTPGEDLDTSCGSLAYSAPEILLGDAYDAPKVDSWSLGVILYMLVAGRLPFNEANDSETLTKILDCSYRLPAHITPACKDVINRLLVRDSRNRASVSEVADMEWVKGGHKGHAQLLPLVSRTHVSEEQHQMIIDNMVEGNVADQETIHKALEEDDYSSVTATYYLLAERLLKRERMQEASARLAELVSSTESGDGETVPASASGGSVGKDETASRDSGSSGASSRRNSWRAGRICTIVKEESEEELEGYLRSPLPTPGGGGRTRPPSVCSSASPSVSAHNLPAAIAELQDLMGTSLASSLASRPRTPPERLSSRSPSPGSGRTSPAPRFKAPGPSASIRKLASSPHLRGICEEAEDGESGSPGPSGRPAQTYSAVRMIRPRQAVVSPDVIRRYERVYGRSGARRSTSCSSSEASDDDGHWLLSRYCRRDGSDREDGDGEPPPGNGPARAPRIRLLKTIPTSSSAPSSKAKVLSGSGNPGASARQHRVSLDTAALLGRLQSLVRVSPMPPSPGMLALAPISEVPWTELVNTRDDDDLPTLSGKRTESRSVEGRGEGRTEGRRRRRRVRAKTSPPPDLRCRPQHHPASLASPPPLLQA